MSLRRRVTPISLTNFIKEVKNPEQPKEIKNYFLYGHCTNTDCPFEEVVGYQYWYQIEDADYELEQLFEQDHDPDCPGKLITRDQQRYSEEEISRRRWLSELRRSG